jgi:hypothetical protein
MVRLLFVEMILLYVGLRVATLRGNYPLGKLRLRLHLTYVIEGYCTSVRNLVSFGDAENCYA